MDTQGTEQSATPANDHVINSHQADCIIRAAMYLGQAVNLLRIADTPETRNLALEIKPLVGRVEKVGQ